MKQKTIKMILCCISLIFLFSVQVNADLSSGNCGAEENGSNLSWRLDDNGILYISGTGAMADYTNSNNIPWRDYISQVKQIVINSGVVNIGNMAFADCQNLEKVSIPNTVTKIGSSSFSHCTILDSIIIPNNVTEIGPYAFWNCKSLSNIQWPTGLQTIGNAAFFQCSSLEYINLVSVVTIEDNAFQSCNSVKKVSLPKNLERINATVFKECQNLSEIVVDDNCSLFSSDDGVLYNAGKNKIILYANKAQNEYSIPLSVNEIGEYAFYGAHLSKLFVPKSVATIGAYAFYETSEYSTEITSLLYYGKHEEWAHINISRTNNLIWSNGISISFLDDENLEVPVINSGSCGENGANIIWTLDKNGLLSIHGTGKMENYLGQRMGYFAGASWYNYYRGQIKQIVIGEGITSVGDYAFYDCYSVEKCEVPKSITYIGDGAFYNCVLLQDFSLNPGLESIGEASFQKCSNLRTAIIPDTVITIGDYAYSGCTSIRSVFIPSSISSFGQKAFSGCTSLVSLQLTDGLAVIGTYAFENCVSLYRVVIPSSVKNCFCSFYGCTFTSGGPIGGLDDIQFAWTEEIPEGAFEGCLNVSAH